MRKDNYSINEFSNPLVDLLIKNKERLNIELLEGPMGCRIIDAGINVTGSIEAGLKISEICLGGLGQVRIFPSPKINISSYSISVHSSKPVLACLGSQYAGWSLSHENFFSLGSGPIRSIVQKEEIFLNLTIKIKIQKLLLFLKLIHYRLKKSLKRYLVIQKSSLRI